MKLKKHANGKYYAHITTEHGPQQIALKTGNLDEARLLAKEAKIEDLERAAKVRALTAETVVRITAGGRVTCAEALVEWEKWAKVVGLVPNTRNTYRLLVNAFLRDSKLLKRPPTAITEELVDAYVNPVDSPISLATRRARLAALQSFTSVCVAKGFAQQDVASIIRVKFTGLTHEQKEPEKREPFTPDEMKVLRSLDDPMWKAAVLIAHSTGLRLGDVFQLEWASLRQAGKIVVWTDKRDARIQLDLPREVGLAIAALPKLDSRYVFPEQAAMVQDGKRRSILSVYFSRILKRHGIEGKSFHSIRHTFATEHKQAGATIDEIRLKLGHRVADTTEGYVHA